MFEAGRSGKFEKMPPLRGSTKTGGQQLQICRAYGAADSTENGVLDFGAKRSGDGALERTGGIECSIPTSRFLPFACPSAVGAAYL